MDVDLGALVKTLRASLADRLEAVLLVGSAVMGDFREASSDLDVVVAVDRPIGDLAPAVADRLDDGLPPRPARKLELVAYTLRQLERPSPGGSFELNYNSDTRAPDVSGHWFLIDLAIAREHSRALVGPSGRELIGPITRPVLIEALKTSLEWHERFEPTSPNAVLGACRAWLFAVEGRWGSKAEAAAWARPRSAYPETIATAERERLGEVPAAPVLSEARSALAFQKP